MKAESAGNNKENLGNLTYTDVYLMMPTSEIGDFGGQPIQGQNTGFKFQTFGG